MFGAAGNGGGRDPGKGVPSSLGPTGNVARGYESDSSDEFVLVPRNKKG